MNDLKYIQKRLLEIISEIEDFQSQSPGLITGLAWGTVRDNVKSAVLTIDLAEHALEGR